MHTISTVGVTSTGAGVGVPVTSEISGTSGAVGAVVGTGTVVAVGMTVAVGVAVADVGVIMLTAAI